MAASSYFLSKIGGFLQKYIDKADSDNYNKLWRFKRFVLR